MTKRRVAAVYGGVLLFALLPVLLFRYPKMVDYPSHLARYYFSQVLPDHPILSRFLTNEWVLIPNLAADLLAWVAGSMLPIYDAGRLVILVAIVLWFVALIALQHALWRRVTIWPILAVAFLFNGNFAWGFLNYYVDTAVMVLGFAGWIYLGPRHWVARLAYGLVTASAIYVGHLFVVGVYGLLLGTYELGQARASKSGWVADLARRWLVVGISFVPAGLLFLGVEAGHGELKTVFMGIGDLVIGLVSSIAQFNIPLDTGLFILCVLIFWHGLRRGHWLELHPAMIFPLVALVLFSLVMPKMLFAVLHTHFRLPFLAMIVLTVSCRFTGGPKAARIVGGLVAAILVVRIGTVIVDWERHGEEVAELRDSFHVVEQGATVFPAFGFSYNSRDNYFKAPHWHSLSYIVIDRSAFIPLLFTGSQLTVVKPEYRDLDIPQTIPVNLDTLAEEFEEARTTQPFVSPRWYKFDYLFVLYPRDPVPTAINDVLEPIGDGSFFRIYKIKK